MVMSTDPDAKLDVANQDADCQMTYFLLLADWLSSDTHHHLHYHTDSVVGALEFPAALHTCFEKH